MISKIFLIKLLILSLNTTVFGEILTVPVKIGVEIVVTTNFRITDNTGNHLNIINLNHGTIRKDLISNDNSILRSGSAIASEAKVEYQIRKYVEQTGEDAVLGSSSNSKVRIELSGNSSNMSLKTVIPLEETALINNLLDTLSVFPILDNSATRVVEIDNTGTFYEVAIPQGTVYHRGEIKSTIFSGNILEREIGTYETSTPVYLTVTYTAE